MFAIKTWRPTEKNIHSRQSAYRIFDEDHDRLTGFSDRNTEKDGKSAATGISRTIEAHVLNVKVYRQFFSEKRLFNPFAVGYPLIVRIYFTTLS